ncbi:MAG: hypothetical protein ACJAVO_000029 [Parvibaculaceae bacterium]|jgi:uncharacterized protein (TIGR00369 family)|nr:PaaI family thioesterase [Parvibaculaceae bacterium]
MDAEQLKEAEEVIKSMLIDHVPHAKAIQMEVQKIEPAKAWLTIPYQDKLVGNPDTGVIHGGVITSLLDNASGIATQMALPERQSIATLDLRIDYMKPATPGEGLVGHAHCYKITKNIGFVRATAYHTTPEDPIATSVGTFMLAANRAVPMGNTAEAIAKTEALMKKANKRSGE